MWNADHTTDSETIPYVLVTGEAAEERRKEWKLAALPAVVATDAHGNLLTALVGSGQVKGQAVRELGRASGTAAEQYAAARAKDLERANEMAGNPAKLSQALALWDSLRTVKGLPCAAEADAALARSLAEADATIDGLNLTMLADPDTARKELTRMIAVYKGYPPSDKARETLRALRDGQ